jgi:trans-aconitate methyltransferase
MAIERWLWELYAHCYDAISALVPYERMLNDVIAEAADGQALTRILDAGCGTGNLTHLLLRHWPDAQVIGVDKSTSMLRRARQKNPRAILLQDTLDGDLAEITGHFDLIVCCNVLYALIDPRRSASMLKSRLAPHGRLVVTTPKAGVQISEIMREHLRHRGILATIRLIAPLLAVAIINAQITRTKRYHFMSQVELENIVGSCGARPTYAAQAWIISYPEKGPGRAGQLGTVRFPA